MSPDISPEAFAHLQDRARENEALQAQLAHAETPQPDYQSSVAWSWFRQWVHAMLDAAGRLTR